MEENKRNTGTYSFYKFLPLTGRPSSSIRDLLSKIKNIERKHPQLFYEVLNMQGVCTNIDELNLLNKILTKKVRSYNKIKSKFIHCRFSEDEISFFKNELEKEVENKEWRKENSFNAFISKKINYSVENLKVYEIDDFKKFKTSSKNILGSSTPIKINESNFYWIESISKSQSVTMSDVIRVCLYFYRKRIGFTESIKAETQDSNQIVSEYKLTRSYRLFFKPKKVSVSPNTEMFDLLKEIKEIENKHYELVKETAIHFGLCNTHLDLILFKDYILKRIECIKHNRPLIQPLCLTQSGIPILASFVIKSITENKDISELEENLITNSQTILKQEDLASNLSLSFLFLIYKTMLEKKEEAKKNFPSILKEINESIEINKPMEDNKLTEDNQTIKKTKKCLNCGEEFTYRKKNKIVCNQKCYRDFKRKEIDKSILISEEPISEKEFNPFEEPVIVRDYTLNLDVEKIAEPYQEESFEFIFDNLNKLNKDKEIERKIELDVIVDKIRWLVESVNKNIMIKYDELESVIKNSEHRIEMGVNCKVETIYQQQSDLLLENHSDLLDKLNNLEKIISEKEKDVVVAKNTSKLNYLMVFLLLFLSSFFLFYLLNKNN